MHIAVTLMQIIRPKKGKNDNFTWAYYHTTVTHSIL